MAMNEQNQMGGGMLARTGAGAPGAIPPGQEQAMPPGQEQAMPPGQEQIGGQGGQGLQDVSGEEQDYYDRVVTAGMHLLYGNEKTSANFEERLKAGKATPAQTLADTASLIIIQLDKKQNDEIPETVILPAATEILEHVIEFADSIKAFPIDAAVQNRAGQLMVMELGDYYGVSDEDIQELLDTMNPDMVSAAVEEQDNFARKQPPIPTEPVEGE
jgi:predicted Zn-dependent protease with MMP-like domain